MNSHSPYPSVLLNDLHHHFPELLYHTERFHTVQDVLQYIVRVASDNPYDREHERYRRRSIPPLLDPTEPTHLTEPTQPTQPTASLAEEKEEMPTYRCTPSSSAYTLPPRAPIHSYPSRSPSPPLYSASASASTSESSQLDPESLLRALFQPDPTARLSSNRFRLSVPLHLTSFLSPSSSVHSPSSLYSLNPLSDLLQPVVIRPTEQHLAENTYVYRSEVPHQENCAICQDPMEAEQETRTILACSHCFHRECIDQWFQEHVRCPTCRRDVRES